MAQSAQDYEVSVNLKQIGLALLKAMRWIIPLMVLVGIGGFFFLSSLTPKYTSRAELVVEDRQSALTRLQVDQNRAGQRNVNREIVGSEAQILRSRDIAASVVDKLKLSRYPEFNKQGGSMFSGLLLLLGMNTEPDGPALDAREKVLKIFSSNLVVYQIVDTHVIAVEYTSSNPRRAADIVTAVIDEYLALQRRARQATTSRGVGNLDKQIAQLRRDTERAEQRVADFRAQTGLFKGTNNNTLIQQELSELTAQLTRIRSQRAQAEAKARLIRANLKSGQSINNIPDVVNSPYIQRLQEQRVRLQAQKAQLASTLLPQHPSLQRLQAQLNNLNTQVRREGLKIAGALENTARLAAANERSIRQQMANSQAKASQGNADQVRLSALELEASTFRKNLEYKLGLLRDSGTRGAAKPSADPARVTSQAIVPIVPSFPKKGPMLAAMLVATLLLSMAYVVTRELTVGAALTKVRNGAPLEQDDLPLPVGELPLEGDVRVAAHAPEPEPDVGLIDAEPAAFTETAPHVAPELPMQSPVMSRDAALHTDKVSDKTLGDVQALMLSHNNKRMGGLRTFVMGKMDLGAIADCAVQIARQVAQDNQRVILLDLGASGPWMLHHLQERARPGLTDLLTGQASFGQVIHRDARSRIHYISAGQAGLSSQAMQADNRLNTVLAALEQTYDQVVICGGLASDMRMQLLGGHFAVFVTEGRLDDPQANRMYDDLMGAGACDVAVIRAVAQGASGSAKIGSVAA